MLLAKPWFRRLEILTLLALTAAACASDPHAKPGTPGADDCHTRCAAKIATCGGPADAAGGGSSSAGGGSGSAGGGSSSAGPVRPTAAQCAEACTHLYEGCNVVFPDTNGNPITEDDCVRGCPTVLDLATVACFTATDCSDDSLNACIAVSNAATTAPATTTPPATTTTPAASGASCDDLCGGNPDPTVLDCLDDMACGELPGALANHTCEAPAMDPPAMDPPAMNPPAMNPPAMNPPAMNPPACSEGSKRCGTGVVESCHSGKWSTSQSCSNGCANSACTAAPPPAACVIPKNSLHAGISFPYYSADPPTVLESVGLCYHSSNGVVSEGWNGASALNVLADDNLGTPSVVDVSNAHVLYSIDFKLKQRKPYSTELGTLSLRTGVPVGAIASGTSEQIIETTQTKPTTVGYTLPTGVSLTAFIPSSASSPGSLSFQASAANRGKLDQVLSDLHAGIKVELEIGRFSGSNRSTYTLLIKTGALYEVTVTAIAP